MDLHKWPEYAPQRGEPHGFFTVLGTDFAKTADLIFFLSVGLDDANSREIFQDIGAQGAYLFLSLARTAKNLPAKVAHDDWNKRHRHHRPQGEPGIDGDHQCQAEKNHHNGIDDRQRTESHELAHRVNIVGQTRHEIADLVVLKIAQRQCL